MNTNRKWAVGQIATTQTTVVIHLAQPFIVFKSPSYAVYASRGAISADQVENLRTEARRAEFEHISR